MLFDDRADAGRQLSLRLRYLDEEDTVVVGLPRGGVPVAYEVAVGLGAPLDVIVVRKLGVPHQPELAFGAVSEDGIVVIDNGIVTRARLTLHEMAEVERHERQQLVRRTALLRSTHPRITLCGRTVIVVDDGVATGATIRAACQDARARGARRIVLAVPVVPRAVLPLLAGDVDETVCLASPSWFGAVGRWYGRFDQVSDAEVADLLRRAAGHLPAPPTAGADDPLLRNEPVRVITGGVALNGYLTVPEHPLGLVVFAYGSGSSRHSPRNRYVAEVLNRAGLGTLLVDLLTLEEETDRSRVFDIGLLSRRLVDITVWLSRRSDVDLRIGYFGASTGAAAALRATADPAVRISAVVSQGGRPDLAGPHLGDVTAPTMLIVGGDDEGVLALNRRAMQAMTCETALTEVPGATHLFAEPGALEKVAAIARTWFVNQLSPSEAAQQPAREQGVYRPGGGSRDRLDESFAPRRVRPRRLLLQNRRRSEFREDKQ
ncbi:phosphoribosyltransferase family protein [Nocardia sp. NBC_01009]|uniref:phosphoribosyltransferase family protein n=1 Tax=Nocardia sp. NBC_01009 TaxID=2975996 RepID=UPI0038681815